MAKNGVLDFGRIDVLAARDDHVLHPVMDKQEPVLVEIACIARIEKSVADRLLRGFWPVPIAFHDKVGLDRDLANLAGWHRISLRIHAANDGPGIWHAARAQLAPGRLMRFWRQECCASDGFGQTIKLGKPCIHQFPGGKQ